MPTRWDAVVECNDEGDDSLCSRRSEWARRDAVA